MISRSVLEKYADEVSEELRRTYGLTWADACGEVEPLSRALEDGTSPAEFVREFAEKYDLQPVPKY